MCLLVTQTADVKFDDDFLAGVYMKNSDGIGVMFSDNNRLMIKKFLPKTEKQFIQFYRDHIEGRDCSWHARMRTHGDIDMNNCHPYPVLTKDDGYPLYLAHNGVLHTGNNADTRKSDTWHFINDFLRPMLLKNPEFFTHPAFSELIGEYIGSGNKFVLLDAYGNMVTINKERGVEHNGAWLSNTYAWDTAGTKFDVFRNRSTKGSSSLYGYGGYGDYSGYGNYGGLNDDGDDVVNPALVDMTPTADIDDGVDFLCEFFDMVRFCKFDEDKFDWDVVDQFYKAAGSQFAYIFLEDVADGYYDESETLAVLHSFLEEDPKYDDEDEDDHFPTQHLQSEVNKEVTVE